jgi:hypothetical protein
MLLSTLLEVSDQQHSLDEMLWHNSGCLSSLLWFELLLQLSYGSMYCVRNNLEFSIKNTFYLEGVFN